MKFLLGTSLLLAFFLAGCVSAGSVEAPALTGVETTPITPRGSQVTIVIMENKDYGLVVGSLAGAVFQQGAHTTRRALAKQPCRRAPQRTELSRALLRLHAKRSR